MASKVYFTDMCTAGGEPLPRKLRRLIDTAGMGDIDFKGKFVAIKLHFGEPGNLAFLRPNYAKVVADYIRERGGKPFLTDCNTLYIGGRRNAIDHLEAAYENGFSPLTTGCHVIIADGLKGNDEERIAIDGEEFKEAMIGRALVEADIIISLTHFKGHESAGFGGTFKNIGMGGGSRAGKLAMHSADKPDVDEAACIGCETCATQCAHDAISYEGGVAHIDGARCAGCCRCMGVCPTDAINTLFDADKSILNRRIVEYTMAVLKDKPSFHISLAIDISPGCDCDSCNDIPIVPNVGMFASYDPVAIDMACVDAVNAMPANPGSELAGAKDLGDHFKSMYPSTNWRALIDHAVKLNMGSEEYELIKI